MKWSLFLSKMCVCMYVCTSGEKNIYDKYEYDTGRDGGSKPW